MKSDDQSPKTIGELGIAFVGFERLVDEKFATINTTVKALTDTVKESSQGKANKKDLEEVELRVAAIETRERKYVTTTQLWGTIVGAGTVIAVIISFWNLIEKIRG